MSDTILRIGQVVSVDDENGAGRIKVRLMEDHGTSHKELPYAFPLNPKMFQCVPKVGECALVILTRSDNKDSQRYYIGPIVSQPQEMSWAPYVDGSGSAVSVIQSRVVGPKQPIENFASTEGAFPKTNDVAIVGRKGEDIILKGEGSLDTSGSEIDLRCGVRKMAYADYDKDCVGPIIFNSENPAYIQMRHKRNLLDHGDGDGVINVVADKINLVSYKQTDTKGAPGELLTNTDGQKNSLLDDSDMRELLNRLHTSTYADILIPILKKMCMAISNHVHPMGTLPPCKDEIIKAVDQIDPYTIESNNVRIS